MEVVYFVGRGVPVQDVGLQCNGEANKRGSHKGHEFWRRGYPFWGSEGEGENKGDYQLWLRQLNAQAAHKRAESAVEDRQ